MTSRRLLGFCLALLAGASFETAGAHPAPFSYLDLFVDGAALRGTLVIHDFDAAHELGIEDPVALDAPGVVTARAAELVAVLDGRLRIEVDGEAASLEWQAVESLPDRDSLRFAFLFAAADPVLHLEIEAVLFPYDPIHQTFVNLYEQGSLSRQAILDTGRPRLEHYAGDSRGPAAVFGDFLVAGAEHLLIGPDHLAFLLGLLLLGGTFWRLAAIVTAFTLGHSITLSLAVLDWVRLPSSVVEPAIALSIVVVGVDNLLLRRRREAVPDPAAQPAERRDLRPRLAARRDLRPWLAAVFGLIHGFGFAAVLREIGLPPESMAWSLAGFNFGVELGQLGFVALALALLVPLRRYSVDWAERLAVAGSVAVAGFGVWWFLQRIGVTA